MVLVGAMAYAVAFAETLSISGFPYYEFEDRDMAYVFGSAFYGIYFIVRLDHVQFIRWLAPASTLLTLIARLYVYMFSAVGFSLSCIHVSIFFLFFYFFLLCSGGWRKNGSSALYLSCVNSN